jgi:parallel beta-helix repeat protein
MAADSQDLPGETNATLTLTHLSTNQTGFYSVAISNSLGSTMSTSARLTVTPAITLGEAVDAPQLVWTTSGDAPWMSECSVTTDGVDAVRSGYLDNLQNSWLQTITGPGTISFWCKVSSPSFAMLIFSVNNTEKAWLSGEIDWQQRTFVLTGKTNILAWKYYKDRWDVIGSDCAWLDRVSFTPDEPPRITQQPVSQTVVSGSKAHFSVGVDSIGQVTCKWLKNGITITGSTTTNLILSSVTTNQAGNYSVIVSNSVGTAVSSNAVLQVLPPLDPNVATIGPAGAFGGWPGAVVSRSNYVYLAQAEGLQVLDVTDRQNPQEVTRLDLNDETASLAWQSNYLYAALRTGKLVIFDLTNPEQPVETGRCNLTFSWSAQIAVLRTNAYVACDDQLVRVMDVANPAAPRYLRSVTVPATAIAVSTNRAYVAGSQRLTVLDLSNPSNPTTLGFSPEGGQSIGVQGNYAYLGSPDGMRIFDISNPAAISRVAFYRDDGAVGALAIEGSLAYLGVLGFNGVSPAFRILDISNPQQPVPLGRLSMDEEIVRLAMKPPTAFVVQTTGFRVVDVTTPSSPSSITLRPVPSTVNQAIVVGSNLYLATDLGPWIYRLDDPANPTLVKAYNDTPDLKQIFIADQRLYEIFHSQTNTSVTILDATNPEAMNRLGSYNPQRVTQDLYVQAGRLYLVNQYLDKSWLEVADVSNPVQATKLGERELPGPGRTFCIADNLAYVGWGDGTNNGVSLIDVSNPASLQAVGTISIVGIPTSLFATGNRFYLGSSTLAGWWTLEMYDVSQPAAPAYVTRVDGDGTIWGLDVKEDLVFAAISGHSVFLFKQGPNAFEQASVCESPAAIGLAVTPASASGIGYVYTPEGSGSLAENYKAGYLGLTIQKYTIRTAQIPVLTLSGGNPEQLIAAIDPRISNEVEVLTFSLKADIIAEWTVYSVAFQASGEKGDEYKDITYARLYEGSTLLGQRIFGANDGKMTFDVNRKIAPGGTLSLRLVYLFDTPEVVEPPFPKSYQIQTSMGMINARPTDPSYGDGIKLPPAPATGSLLLGPVWNANSQKGFLNIQDAIDDDKTKEGDTIIACPGVYVENIYIYIPLTIISHDGQDATTIQAAEADLHVVDVDAANTHISGFTIRGATAKDMAGVYIFGDGRGHCRISDNILTANFYGIYLAGAADTVIVDNFVADNLNNGIHIIDSQRTTIEGNTIGMDEDGFLPQANGGDGILIFNSWSNIIGGNSYAGNIISGNISNGVHVLGVQSRGNTVEGNWIGPNDDGNWPPEAQTKISNGENGILIENAPANWVGKSSRNTVSLNGKYGIEIRGSLASANAIYSNYIGTDAEGISSLPNACGIGIVGASSNLIGKDFVGLGNIISGNNGAGIEIKPSSDLASLSMGNEIRGNIIGCMVGGTNVLGNKGSGICIIDSPENIIGGDTSVRPNLISGNKGNGILIQGNDSHDNSVCGNFIGCDIKGWIRLPNELDGILVDGAGSNSIGLPMAGSGNLISGNLQAGIHLKGTGATLNDVCNNLVGTDGQGQRRLPNEWGIVIEDSSFNQIGSGTMTFDNNLISGNEVGVWIKGGSAHHNIISGNYIGTDVNGTNMVGNGFGVYIENAPLNIVGGVDFYDGNVISGNDMAGVSIAGAKANGNQLWCNFIGTDNTGSRALPNMIGVHIEDGSENVVGDVKLGNVISGNGEEGFVENSGEGCGIVIEHSSSRNNRVKGNWIGTDRTGTLELGNRSSGICVIGACTNVIGGFESGTANIIAFNRENGIEIHRMIYGNAIHGNSIFKNTKLGIELVIPSGTYGVNPIFDPLGGDWSYRLGGNKCQNFPILKAAQSSAGIGTVVRGNLLSAPGKQFYVQFYSSREADPSGYGEGEVYLGMKRIRTNAKGMADFVLATLTPAPNQYITATATDSQGNTSEFSQAVVALPGVDSDFDGVLDWLEASAPNNGDGNKDGIPDSQQANVISTPVSTSGYVAFNNEPIVTLASSAPLSGVKTRSAKEIPPLNHPYAPVYEDLLSFLLKTNAPGLKSSGLRASVSEVFQVELFQSENVNATAYFRYGPTPDNPTNYWYRFDYDGTTGALILTNKIVLYFVDGLRGDDDLTVNGIVVHDAGVPAIPWSLAFVNLQYWPDDPVELQLQTVPTRTYRIDASSNLVDWTGWATTNATDHITDFLDTNAPAFRQRFYRAVEWP